MEDSTEVQVSPKKIKKSRWGPVTENDSPIKKDDDESEKVIPNGTGNVSSENLQEDDIVKEKPKTVKISKISKSATTGQKSPHKESSPVKPQKVEKTPTKPQKEELAPLKVNSPSDSPTSSQYDNGFHGFESVVLSEQQSAKQDALHRILAKLNALDSKKTGENLGEAGASGSQAVDLEVDSEEGHPEDEMTVDTGHASDSDSDQMEIDMGNDKENSSRADSVEFSDRQSRAKDLDVDIMETDSVKSAGKVNKRNRKGTRKSSVTDVKGAKSSILESTLKGTGNAKVEYCGGCEEEVDDAEDGICCDGKCERWFHLRCSGLSQAEYEELGRDENAKWACNKCSGKTPSPTKQEGKPLLTVRKDLTKVITPPLPAKRKSVSKETVTKTPKIDISNPAYLKPFDFGWKRELVFRNASENNRRQGDVYYYTPKGKKLRSLREISDYLEGTDLTQDNFTFWKEPLGIEDPEKEIIRDAKFKALNSKDSTLSPPLPKKITATTPKLAKTPKTPTPKLTATVTPLESPASATVTPVASALTPASASPVVAKASASVTPRVVLKGKTTVGSGPKFKATPSKATTPGQAQKIVISKDKKKKASSDDEELEMGMLPPTWEHPKPKDNKSAGVKRPLERVEHSPPAKRAKTDVEVPSPVMQNFLQNVNHTYKALLHAFQYLKVQELLRASRVCHMWRDMALHKSLWESVRMKNSHVKDWEGFSGTLRRTGTRHLDLRKMIMPDKPEPLKAMWGDCIKALSKVTSLVRLELCRCVSSVLEQIVGSCPQLEAVIAVTIKSNQLDLENFKNCQNLTELKLKSLSGIELTNVTELGNLSKLKHLSLTTVKNIKSVLEVVGKMTQLESLELGEFTSVPEDLVIQTFSQLTRLRKLRLEKGQQECPTDTIFQTISKLPSLIQLELINFDVKVGFDESLGLCTNIKMLLIIPTYVTQSATTNHLVIEGVSKLTKTLNHFTWGLTLELLRVTDLFIDQWEAQKKSPDSAVKSPTPNQAPQKKSSGDSIPILKPSNKDGKKSKESGVTQVDVLQLPKLHKVLSTILPNTKIVILKVPFSATWRQSLCSTTQ